MATACFGGEKSRSEQVPVVPANGPAADYPILVGAPYTIAGVTHTPIDTMNYDAVGRASLGSEGGDNVSGAHHTLPVPSYVEVTALDSGITTLVRIERRGPMSGNQLIELSPGATAQLGLLGKANVPVRVRRVNPIEADRALLRAGNPAPARMETPRSLLNVLQRKLDNLEGVVRAPVAPEPEPVATPAADPKPAKAPKPAKSVKKPEPKPEKKPEPEKKQEPASKPTTSEPKSAASAPGSEATQSAKGSHIVQVGTFANKTNADAVAHKLGVSAVQSGKFWRVKMGPFPSLSAAEAALAKAKAAGYSDARIQRAN